MSSAPARLELVPPSAPQPPIVPPRMPAVLSPAERNASTAKARRIFLRLWITGCAVVPLVALLGEMLDEAILITLIPLGILVMPVSGIALWCIALYARSREAMRALLAATLALIAAVALIQPASEASVELFVASRQAELDALAVDVRRAVEPMAPDDRDERDLGLSVQFDKELSAVGISNVAVVDGGLLFVTSWGSRLLYADGGAGPPPPMCEGPRVSALGGRWFMLRCGDAVREYDDW